MPASDDENKQKQKPRVGGGAGAGSPAAKPPSAPQLPPTQIAEVAEPADLPSEPTRALALPPTQIVDLDAEPALAQIDTDRGTTDRPPPPDPAEPGGEGGAPEPLRVPPSAATPSPGGKLLPPPRSASELAHRPRPDAREETRARRERALGAVGTTLFGAAIALGVITIVLHLLSGGAEAGDGATAPILMIAGGASAAPAPARTERARPRAIAVDPRADLATLERQAVEHLAAGRRADAASVYAVLAERAPHQRAYVLAARILADQAREGASASGGDPAGAEEAPR